MRETIEARLGRLRGMKPEATARVREAEAKLLWTATCRKCHARLEGLPAELKAHRCG